MASKTWRPLTHTRGGFERVPRGHSERVWHADEGFEEFRQYVSTLNRGHQFNPEFKRKSGSGCRFPGIQTEERIGRMPKVL